MTISLNALRTRKKWHRYGAMEVQGRERLLPAGKIGKDFMKEKAMVLLPQMKI